MRKVVYRSMRTDITNRVPAIRLLRAYSDIGLKAAHTTICDVSEGRITLEMWLTEFERAAFQNAGMLEHSPDTKPNTFIKRR